MIHLRLHSCRGRHLYSKEARMGLSISSPSHRPCVSRLSDLYNTKLNITLALCACSFTSYVLLSFKVMHSNVHATVLPRSVFVGEKRSFEEQRQPGRAEAAHELVMVLLFLVVVLSRKYTHTLFLSNSQLLMLNPSFSRPCQDIQCR